ncbi:LssY C-terminal domain-containing protein [Methyloligella sp. 2.7D]|uniref:LssY C-terminal domain-containing protein n=1 Tax=unclassified Methyloligella TaxID=2625955 RepID=UPI00157E1932|nr:LssY C-terminal domain-containing protein [Methyloligella sp. GL2]QKP76545.1 LssY C-terminal domain-containing protein [Methyloligella sp. GL2]
MRLLLLTLQRTAVVIIGAFAVWLIVYVFNWADGDLPTILALAITYGVGAYLILPYAVRMGLKIQARKHVPSFTVTGDGLPGDPVNLTLIGTENELRTAFAAAGWHPADPLSLKSSWLMVQSFVLDQPYPTAPFSTLFLFGRGQDIGFQLPIGDSPRKRHHVRFWAKTLTEEDVTGAELADADFWLNTDRPDHGARLLWVGAGTKDIGLSLTRLTFKMTHATDSDTNIERDFIMAELEAARAIHKVRLYDAGDRLAEGRVNHYVTDGDIALAELKAPA